MTTRSAISPFIRTAISSCEVLSPHISLCRPSIQISPGFVVGSVACSNASSALKSSSTASGSTASLSTSSVRSSCSKPVSDMSKSPRSRSSSRSFNFNSSHSPVILFSAMFRAFSLCLSRSTTTTSTSSYPKSMSTVVLWCPPMIVPSSFTMMGSTYPNSSMLRFIFWYSASSGVSAFRGLYSAAFKSASFLRSVFSF